jgi:hypothetical protein
VPDWLDVCELLKLWTQAAKPPAGLGQPAGQRAVDDVVADPDRHAADQRRVELDVEPDLLAVAAGQDLVSRSR